VAREQPYEYIYDAVIFKKKEKPRKCLQPTFASVDKEEKNGRLE
jgi:hypothetical protein